MLIKNFTDLACEYADIVYDRFLEKVYGVKNYTDYAMFDEPEDYQLLILLANSGYKTAEELKSLNIDVDLLGSTGANKSMYYIYNNTTVVNNYNTHNYDAGGFVYVQATPATTWIIANPLGFCPNVTIVDDNGEHTGAQITYTPTCDVITINFNTPLTGKAYLS